MFKVLTLLSLNLLTLTNEKFAPAAEEKQSGHESLNSASLNAIESSWLKVAVGCKSRSFNAEPESVIEKPSEKVARVFASFGEIRA